MKSSDIAGLAFLILFGLVIVCATVLSIFGMHLLWALVVMLMFSAGELAKKIEENNND